MNRSPDFASTDPTGAFHEHARAAGLRYTTDTKPGIRREKNKAGDWAYFDTDDKRITDEKTLKRLAGINLPPAYTDAWFCPSPNGHLQATGIDAKKRKQYRYHPKWKAVRDETKYDRMLHFGDALPQIRARIDHDLSKHGLPREKVLASVIRLLEETRIRVGNAEYAQQNNHYGLTTLRHNHAAVHGQTIHFSFTGKAGQKHEIDVKDKRVARVVQKCLDLPGQDLFEYKDADGVLHDVTSGDVNEYLREIAGDDFTAKDFRTWAGTVLCAFELAGFENVGSPTEAKQNVTDAIRTVAERLGNTPSVCRKCYIHPAVLDSYIDGSMAEDLSRDLHDLSEAAALKPGAGGEAVLTPQETAVLRFLRGKLAHADPEAKAAVTGGK